MPALPNVPKVVRIVEKYLWTGLARPVINSYHWGYTTGDVSAADILAFASLWASTWGTDLSAVFNGALALNEVIATSLSSSTAPSATVPTTHTGTETGPAVPAGVAMVMQRKIARRYRGGHSRVYLPGITASHMIDADDWDPSFLTQMETHQGSAETDRVAGAPSAYGAWFPVNVSYYSGFTNFLEPSGRYRSIPTLRTTPLVDNLISGVFINPKPCSQRRRNGQSA